MHPGEPNEPQTAPDPIGGDTPEQISARKLVWIVALTVVVLLPALIVSIDWIVGPMLSPMERSLLGTWEFVDTDNTNTLTFRSDRTGSSNGDPFSWSLDGDRLVVSETPESYWLRLWHWIRGNADDPEEVRIEFTEADHLVFRAVGRSGSIELRRRAPNAEGAAK